MKQYLQIKPIKGVNALKGTTWLMKAHPFLSPIYRPNIKININEYPGHFRAGAVIYVSEHAHVGLTRAMRARSICYNNGYYEIYPSDISDHDIKIKFDYESTILKKVYNNACMFYGVRHYHLQSNEDSPRLREARRMYCFAAAKKTDETLEKIGKRINRSPSYVGRAKTTVVRQYKQRLEAGEGYEEMEDFLWLFHLDAAYVMLNEKLRKKYGKEKRITGKNTKLYIEK